MPTLFRKRSEAAVPTAVPSGRRATAPTYQVPTPGVGASRPAGKAPRFSYPPAFWLPLRIAGYLVILLGVLALGRPLGYLISSFRVQFWSGVAVGVIALALGLLISLIAGALIADALPSFEVRPDGLAVTEFVRWRVLPWQRITRLHSLTLPGERYLIFVEYAGAPLSPEHLVYGLLAGLGRKNGVFYTSDIRDFEDLTRAILDGRMRATPGVRVEDLLVEGVAMPVVQMGLDPLATMDRVAGFDQVVEGDTLRSASPRPATPRATLVRMQLGLSLVPVALFWVDNLVNGSVPFLSGDTWSLLTGTLGLLALGMLELPFVALAIQALGESTVGNGEQQAALTTYPYLEMPRVLAFVLLFALTVVKFPFILTFFVWIAAIAWVSYLTLLFTQRLYEIPQKQAYLAAGASALVQFLVLIAYNMLRFPGLNG